LGWIQTVSETLFVAVGVFVIGALSVSCTYDGGGGWHFLLVTWLSLLWSFVWETPFCSTTIFEYGRGSWNRIFCFHDA